MALPAKMTTFTFNHTGQPDDLGLQIGVAATIQALFDSRCSELLVYLNALRDALVAVTGAEEIGADNVELTATTVQGQIDELLVAINAIVVGAVPDGSITVAKLHADVEAYFDTQYNDYAHPTGDGNRHVPATSTTSNNKVLSAGATVGSEVWTDVGVVVSTGVAKTAPVDADLIAISDSAASNILKKVTWANVKAALKTYFDTLYNNYVHPTSDGNLHVPATSTTNSRKVLTAGETAGSLSWGTRREIYSGDDTEKTHAGTVLTTIKTVRIAKSSANGINVSRLSCVLEGNVTAGTGTFEIWAGGALLFTLPTTTSTSYVVLQGGADVTWSDNTITEVLLRVKNSGANTTRNRLWDVYIE